MSKTRMIVISLLGAVLLGALTPFVTDAVLAQGGTQPPIVFNWNFTPDGTVAIVAFVLSLLFKYFPWVSTWFAGLQTEIKSGIMALLLIITTVIIVLLHCYRVIQVGGVVCDEQNFVNIALQILWALAVNQGTYKIAPDLNSVQTIKDERDSVRAVKRSIAAQSKSG